MIEFQYFEGCPNAQASLANLMEIKLELQLGNNEIHVVQVPDLGSAERLNFQGSPSILIDGIDIYTGSIPAGYNYSCRVYFFEGKNGGIIPKNFIREKILKYRKG